MRKITAVLFFLAGGVIAQTTKPAFVQHNLVSDVTDLADYTDPGLVNPWGICTSATSPFWLADTGTGLSTLYNSLGVPSALKVVVPPAPSSASTTGKPTGCVFNGASAFAVSAGHNASFIFSTIDGTISGWSSAANATHAIIKVDNSGAGAVYFGLAEGTAQAGPQLYAPNFNSGAIEVYDANFNAVTSAGGFKDSQVPAGFAPFNIQNLNGKLYVAYAQQNASKHFATLGAGIGHIAIFDLEGNLVQHLASGGVLNAPWGVAIAGGNFGAFSNDVLVGNFGDGLINAFNPTTGAMVGTIQDVSGNSIQNSGLWAIQFGNGGNGGDPNALYFAAGIAGEKHGLVGSIQAAPSLTAAGVVNAASFQTGIAQNTWVTITGANLSATTRAWTASDFVDGQLPTKLDGVSVTVNGKPAYVEYISPKQVNILTPVDATQGPVQVQVTNYGLVGASVGATLQSVSPAFFAYSNGQYVVATHADGSVVGPTSLGATPAKAGETLTLWGTGFGPTNPAIPVDQVVLTQSAVTTIPTIMIGGTAAQMSFGGLTAPGLYQFNVTIPSGTASGDASVVAQAGGQSTQANLAIAVQ